MKNQRSERQISIPSAPPAKIRLPDLVNAVVDIWMPALCGGCRNIISQKSTTGRGFCARCKDALEPAANTSEVTSFYAYKGPIKDALTRAKFQRDEASARSLANLFRTGFREHEWPQIDLVTFVPSPFIRQATRGFDLSAMFACAAASILDKRVVDVFLAKPRDALSKSSSARVRTAQVRGRFVLRDPESVNAKRILVVDDIRTSGATLNETSRVLLNAGAEIVHGCCLAQTKEEF